MRNLKYIVGLFAIALFVLISCTKEYKDPTVKTIPIGTVKTIAEVRALYVPGKEVKITEDISVYGVVTADETTGNLYKESYMQDETGALYLRFTSNSSLYIGDSIRVNLKGAKIYKYNQMLQVDSLHADNNIYKIKTQQYRTPEIVTFSELNSDKESYQGKLVQINNVFFKQGGKGFTFADGTNKVDVSWGLQNLTGDTLDVRTSGYANFANDTLPSGYGSFIGIVAQYNSGLQLIIRNPNELSLSGKIPVLTIKDFNNGSITSGGWTSKMIVGTYNWSVSTLGGGSYAMMSNYNAGNTASEAWLISPSNDFSLTAQPTLEFRNAWKYTGAALQLMISTNYDGTSAPSTATWTDISTSATWSTGNFVWTGSGVIDLTAYKQTSVYIAFKYTGSNIDGSTWEVDDIKILK